MKCQNKRAKQRSKKKKKKWKIFIGIAKKRKYSASKHLENIAQQLCNFQLYYFSMRQKVSDSTENH